MNAKKNTAIFHDEHDYIVIYYYTEKKENKSKRKKQKQICVSGMIKRVRSFQLNMLFLFRWRFYNLS